MEERLSGLDFPEIKLAGHQARLKNSLLVSRRFSPNNNLNLLFMIKQVKFAVPALLFLTLVMVVGLSLMPGLNKAGTAQAKELIAESRFAITQLSQEARAQLEELIQADLSKSLEEAYNANDLEYIGEEDLAARSRDVTDDLQIDFLDQETGVASQDGEAKAITTTISSSNSGSDDNVKLGFGKFIADYNAKTMTKIKVLKYTDKNGNKVILGLNADNLPVMQIMVTEK